MICSSALTFPIGLSPGILRTWVVGGGRRGQMSLMSLVLPSPPPSLAVTNSQVGLIISWLRDARCSAKGPTRSLPRTQFREQELGLCGGLFCPILIFLWARQAGARHPGHSTAEADVRSGNDRSWAPRAGTLRWASLKLLSVVRGLRFSAVPLNL